MNSSSQGASVYEPKVYRTWTLDSTRWERISPRRSDIVVGTYPKCGTTWTQRIISLLIFQSPEPLPIMHLSPWIDSRFGAPIDEVVARVESQEHRRFLKTHLPWDGLPHYEEVRYIHVARDGRDSCMSFFNHCSAYTDAAYAAFDAAAEEMGEAFPRTPADPHIFWREWLTRGVLPGAKDGWPDLSYFDFETSWWEARGEANVLLVHYNDLKADLDGEMGRIATFLGIETPTELWAQLVEAASFGSMKKDGQELLGPTQGFFEGGPDRFLFRGTNGRWRDVMTGDELELYDRAARRLTPGLARWLEHGRHEAGDPESSRD